MDLAFYVQTVQNISENITVRGLGIRIFKQKEKRTGTAEEPPVYGN
jgi:hypothetical protein